MSDHKLTLIGGWASPFVMRVRIALHLKALDYEMLQETFGAKSDLLLRSNPVHKKIPVLIHDGAPVCESMIIVEYIDETWASLGTPIVPHDPYDRATARFWTAYIDDKLCALIFRLRAMISGTTTEAEKQAEAGEMAVILQRLEEAFHNCSGGGGGKGFFGGDDIGYLDIAVGSYLGWIKAVEKIVGVKFLDGEKVPGLSSWAERFCGHDAVKEIMPDADKLVEFTAVVMAAISGDDAK